MGIYKAIADHNSHYANLKIPPIFINDLPNTSEVDRNRNNDYIYREHGNIFNTTPRCGCGKTCGERFIGVVARCCDTEVTPVLESNLESRVWMRVPRGINTNVFINHSVYNLLSDYFRRKKKTSRDTYVVETTSKPKRAQEVFNPIQWLMCTDYHPKNAEAFVSVMEKHGFKRGYSYFVNNFSTILDKLFKIPEFNTPLSQKGPKRAKLIEVLNRSNKAIFCHYLPLISRDLVVVEKESISRYMDATVPLAVNAARLLLGIDTSGCELRAAARENRTAKAIIGLANFTLEYGRNNIASKPGLARQQAMATRSDNSMRAVITSNTAPHRYDELLLPWAPSVGMFRTYIQNYLMRYGFTPLEMAEFLSYTTTNWHSLTEYIFKTIFGQNEHKGISMTHTRNPSLERASIQFMLATRVKADVRDQSTSFSILSVVGPNAK